MQLDQMWSFVGAKGNKQWIWLAIDADSREIVGVFVGARSRGAAHRLWQSLAAVYARVFRGKLPRETLDASALFAFADFWEADEQVLPSKRHRAVGKQTGKTN
jgi:hypothetical protein